VRRTERGVIFPVVVLSLCLLCGTTPSSEGCTTFCLRDGKHIVVGKNLDWGVGAGLVTVNKRNLSKTAYIDSSDESVTWVSPLEASRFPDLSSSPTSGGPVAYQMELPLD